MELRSPKEQSERQWYAVLSPLDSPMAAPSSVGGANGEITSPIGAEDVPPATVREESAYYDLSTVPPDSKATDDERFEAHYGIEQNPKYPGLSDNLARAGLSQFVVHERPFPDEKLVDGSPQEQSSVPEQPEAENIVDVVPAKSIPVPPARVLPLLDVELGADLPYSKEDPKGALAATRLPEQTDPWTYDGPTYTPHGRPFPANSEPG